MGKDKNFLGPLEEPVLMAVFNLRGEGYGVTIREQIEERTGKDISIGALYAVLDKLENKGFIRSRQGEPTAERGGRAKKYFKIEGAGIQALNEHRRALCKLANGIQWGVDPVGVV